MYASRNTRDFLEEIPIGEKIIGVARQRDRGLIVGEENIYTTSFCYALDMACLGPKKASRYYLADPFVVWICDSRLFCECTISKYSLDLGEVCERMRLEDVSELEAMINGAHFRGDWLFILEEDTYIFRVNWLRTGKDRFLVNGDMSSERGRITYFREKPMRLKPKKRTPFPSVRDCTSSQKSARKIVEHED